MGVNKNAYIHWNDVLSEHKAHEEEGNFFRHCVQFIRFRGIPTIIG